MRDNYMTLDYDTQHWTGQQCKTKKSYNTSTLQFIIYLIFTKFFKLKFSRCSWTLRPEKKTDNLLKCTVCAIVIATRFQHKFKYVFWQFMYQLLRWGLRFYYLNYISGYQKHREFTNEWVLIRFRNRSLLKKIDSKSCIPKKLFDRLLWGKSFEFCENYDFVLFYFAEKGVKRYKAVRFKILWE